MYKVLMIVFIAVLIAACGGSTPNANNGNNGNAKTANGNSKDPLAITTPTPESTTNNAPTLTPVYKAYCEAMAAKNEAALKKVFSSDTVKYIEDAIKDDGLKPPTFVKYFEDEQVTPDLCEVRNEQINGNEAVAEVRTKATPNGVKIVFVKEGPEWKLTNRFAGSKK